MLPSTRLTSESSLVLAVLLASSVAFSVAFLISASALACACSAAFFWVLWRYPWSQASRCWSSSSLNLSRPAALNSSGLIVSSTPRVGFSDAVSFVVLFSGVDSGAGVGDLSTSTASCERKALTTKNEMRRTTANRRQLNTMAGRFSLRGYQLSVSRQGDEANSDRLRVKGGLHRPCVTNESDYLLRATYNDVVVK